MKSQNAAVRKQIGKAAPENRKVRQLEQEVRDLVDDSVETALAKRRGDQPQVAATDGENGEPGEIEILIDARGFIGEEETHAGEAPVTGLRAREADDAGPVGQQERDLIPAVATSR